MAFSLPCARTGPTGSSSLRTGFFCTTASASRPLPSEQRLPSINAYEELVESGGLMSYGPSYEDMHKRAAYLDKILKGAQPGNLPIEQPTKFTFIINLGTAKTLGVTVPSQLLGLADRLIE